MANHEGKLQSMQKKCLDRFTVKPLGKVCCNCGFCRKSFMSDDYYCRLQRLISEILLEYDYSDISCIYTTACGMFSSREDLERMLEVEDHEEFEILKTLGKFNSIPEEIVKMRENFFIEKGDASAKQVSYVSYLATANKDIPPLKISSSAMPVVEPVNDKDALRLWIGSEVSKQMRDAMM